MKPWTEIIVRSLGNDQDLFGGLAGSGSLLNADMFIGMLCNWMIRNRRQSVCRQNFLIERTFLFLESPATVPPQNLNRGRWVIQLSC